MNQTFSKEQLQMLCETAIQAAQEAGEYIEQFDRRNLQLIFKDAGSSEASQIVTEVDLASEEIIRKRLHESSKNFDIAFVGEESSQSNNENSCSKTEERFQKSYFWCVDPLDGTLAFTEGHSGYAVSVALVEQSGKSVIGVVYDPAHQVLYHAIEGQGSFRNLTPLEQTIETPKSLMVYADASFKTHEKYEPAIRVLESCAQTLDLNSVKFVYGSGAVMNACQVLESSHACYLKLPKKEDGGGSIWDYAATACIARETRTETGTAWVSNVFGQSLELNRRESTFMNHQGVIFASNKQIAQFLIDAL